MSARQKDVLFNLKKSQVWELMCVRNIAWDELHTQTLYILTISMVHAFELEKQGNLPFLRIF